MLALNDQMELPFTHKKNKSHFRVEELTRSEQDLQIYHMAEDFVNTVALDESIDFDTFILSCARIRADVDRKYVNAFICYLDGEPVGFLVGVASPCFHRQGIVAEQKLWYVKPKRRATYAAVHLVRAYERWARINGATQIFTGTANKLLSERTSKLLEKLGYARVGYVHVKEI